MSAEDTDPVAKLGEPVGRAAGNGARPSAPPDMLTPALAAWDAGMSPLPIGVDKAPTTKWTRFQHGNRADRDTVSRWFADGTKGLAVICGGPDIPLLDPHLFMFEFEAAAVALELADQYGDAVEAAGLGEVWQRITDGYTEASPSGGVHHLWWVNTTTANEKLAAMPSDDPTVDILLIETRGEGGYVVVAPTTAEHHNDPANTAPWRLRRGGFEQVAKISVAEHEALLSVARGFDSVPPDEPDADLPAFREPAGPVGDRPGDEFDAGHTGGDVLAAAGFTLVHTDGAGNQHYCRPGKDRGWSATVYADLGTTTLWSTSINVPREFITVKRAGDVRAKGRRLKPFQLHTALNFGGDFPEAAKAWRRDHPRAHGADTAVLYALVGETPPATPVTPSATAEPAPVKLTEAEETFSRWLGAGYDLDALRTTLVAAAVERLDGDPLWLLVLSGSGNAKTETVQALAGAGAVMASTLSSEAALLSATPQRDKRAGATGGLLRTIGPRGLLVIKDVTSILSMHRELRAQVLAALREIHDGSWDRHVGTDGGRTLSWAGRIAVIGAVTTAWDRAHDVIASMGDRFLILRMDSTTGRVTAGKRAIANVSKEATMRGEMADAAAGVLAGMDTTTPFALTDKETDSLLKAADLVTLARTGVDFDHAGNVIDAHAPEMPTRFAKELAQVVRGGVAIGMDRPDAMRLAHRCARDSMPPLRLAIIEDVAVAPRSTVTDVRRRLEKPRTTVDRQLQALHILRVLTLSEEPRGQGGIAWRYQLAPGIDPRALDQP